MICPRDQPPFGYAIQFSNNPEHPFWVVMCWPELPPLYVCPTLKEAYLFLANELGEADE